MYPRLEEPFGSINPSRDALLEEMTWLATDLHEERKWKVAASSVVSRVRLVQRFTNTMPHYAPPPTHTLIGFWRYQAAAVKHTRLRWKRLYLPAVARFNVTPTSNVARDEKSPNPPMLRPASVRILSTASRNVSCGKNKPAHCGMEGTLEAAREISNSISAGSPKIVEPATGVNCANVPRVSAAATRAGGGKGITTDGVTARQLVPREITTVKWVNRMHRARLPAILGKGICPKLPSNIASFWGQLHLQSALQSNGVHVVIVPDERRLLLWATMLPVLCPKARLSCACNSARFVAHKQNWRRKWTGDTNRPGGGGKYGARIVLLTLSAFADAATTRALSLKYITMFIVDQVEHAVAKWIDMAHNAAPSFVRPFMFGDVKTCHKILLVESSHLLGCSKSIESREATLGSRQGQSFSTISHALLCCILLPHAFSTLKSALKWLTTILGAQQNCAYGGHPLSPFILNIRSSDSQLRLFHRTGLNPAVPPRQDDDLQGCVLEVATRRPESHPQLGGDLLKVPVQYWRNFSFNGLSVGPRRTHIRSGRRRTIPKAFRIYGNLPQTSPFYSVLRRTRHPAALHRGYVRRQSPRLFLLNSDATLATSGEFARPRLPVPRSSSFVSMNTTTTNPGERAILHRLANACGGVLSNSLALFLCKQLARHLPLLLFARSDDLSTPLIAFLPAWSPLPEYLMV